MPSSSIVKKGGSLRLHITFTDSGDTFKIPKGARISYMYLVNTSNTPLTITTFDLKISPTQSLFNTTPAITSLGGKAFVNLFQYLDSSIIANGLISYATTGEDTITFIADSITSGSMESILLIIGLDTLF